MNQINSEREISIVDFCFKVLLKWRCVIAVMLLGAVGVAGIKVATFKPVEITNASTAMDNYEKEKAYYDNSLKNVDSQISTLQRQMDQLMVYVDQSILMQLDPTAVSYASADFYIEVEQDVLKELAGADERDMTGPLSSAYASFVLNGIDYSDVAKKYNLGISVIKELVSVDCTYNMDVVNVRVIADNEALAADIMDCIVEQVNAEKAKIAKDTLAHKMVVLNLAKGITTDTKLLDQVNGVNTKITNIQNCIVTAQRTKDSLVEPVKPAAVVATGISKNTILKMAVVGLFGGLFIMIVLYLVEYIFNGKIHTPTDIKDIFNFYKLGVFAPVTKKNTFLDKWLRKLAKVESRPDDVIFNRVASNITSLSKDGDKILLTGSVTDELLTSVGEELKKLISGRELLISGNFTEDASVMKLMAEADGVILLEQSEVSRFEDVVSEVEAIKAVGKPVLGYIMK